MIRKLIIGILIVLVVVAALATVKIMQIRTLISMPKPTESATVATAVVHQETWPNLLLAVGSVSAAQGVIVSPEIAGKVSEIAFESGGAVQAGDLLVRLDTSEEEAQLRSAEAQADLAKITAERQRKLQADKTVSQSEVDQADANWKQAAANADNIKAIIQKKTIRAPFAGKLGIRLVNLGEQLDAGKGIVSLQAMSPIFVDFSLPQQEFAQLKTGLKVLAVADSYPTNQFDGEISAINPDLDTGTRSVRVRAKFANADELLHAGMFVRVSVILPQEEPVLVIPSTAILSNPYGDSVFKVVPDGANSTNLVAEQAFIRAGRTRGDYVVVESGLKAGDRVAAAGVFKLRNHMSLQENNEMTPKASQTPTPPNS
jgi:membrane fusion protein (multidrug efflux system)